MKSAAVQLSQGVSRVSMHSSMSLSNDLLKTKKMMIENLIESSEVIVLFINDTDMVAN
jgi:hypothetical protein